MRGEVENVGGMGDMGDSVKKDEGMTKPPNVSADSTIGASVPSGEPGNQQPTKRANPTEAEEKEIARMVALDPSVSSVKPWEFEVTSPYLTKVMVGVMVVVFIGSVFMTIAIDTDVNGSALTFADDIAFIGIGLIGLALCTLIRRPRVRANSDGVEVRNFLGARFYPWDIVYGLAFPQRDRWARLELPEFEFVPMLAFQAGDGKRVVEKVHEFRQLEQRYMPEE